MGKSSKFKQIRKIASSMPLVSIKRVVGEMIRGSEIKDIGNTNEGLIIDPSLMYKRKKIIDAALNHNKKMKKLYNKYGKNGVSLYINAVNAHVDKNKKT